MNVQPSRPNPARRGGNGRTPAILIILPAAGVLYEAGVEFYNIAWGTGAWVGELSFKWALSLALFAVLCISCLLGLTLALWSTPAAVALSGELAKLRTSLGRARWPLAALAIVAPICLLQYSPWGVVVDKPGLRLLTWSIAAVVAALLMTQDARRALTWSGGLAAGLVTGAGFVIAAAFADVTSYPFSLSWSEGNRLWDYSLMFAKRLYVYPAGQAPTAYLDFGRQLLGGLPFLLPHVSIVGERLWLSLLAVVPYFVLGLAAFWPFRGNAVRSSILAAVWVMMFLTQGPIHAPLVICAISVALAWRQPTWLAIPLVALSGYFAEISRFTWMFAPAIWAVMLELGAAPLKNLRIPIEVWRRSLLLGVAGLLGSGIAIATGFAATGTSLGTATAASTQQSLLWYRLLPNATYGNGILLGLLIAAGPLAALLILLGSAHWKVNSLQRFVIIVPLLAFLGVGLIVSTKIGGGGDLHNMDMFLIGLVFVGALEWRIGDDGLLGDLRRPTFLVRAALVLAVGIPAYQSLMSLRPLSFSQDAAWLAVLADAERPRDLGSLPATAVTNSSLQDLQKEVKEAQSRGDVLFMDQRQLLTFGDVKNVSLISDYEKKRMMDEALSGNTAYFQPFYRDLAAHRFSLIVSSPLRTPIKDSEYGFGEENNAWVDWISKPVLCYYEEQDTLAEVKVEFLVPRTEQVDCSAALP